MLCSVAVLAVWEAILDIVWFFQAWSRTMLPVMLFLNSWYG